MGKQTPIIFHESYGDVTRAQLAAYRRFNVSPSDHDDLARTFGENEHEKITTFVKEHSTSGMYSVGWRELQELGL